MTCGFTSEGVTRITVMTDETRPHAEPDEGSYAGTRENNRRTGNFLDEHGNELEALACDAAEALDGAEGEELRKAEAIGKEPAQVSQRGTRTRAGLSGCRCSHF